MPKVDKHIYYGSTRFVMDELDFNKNEIVVVEGSHLVNFPLFEILSQHYQTNSSLTTVVRELDLSQKPKVVPSNDSYEIFGYCDLATQSNLK